jgi:hypothetical protein
LPTGQIEAWVFVSHEISDIQHLSLVCSPAFYSPSTVEKAGRVHALGYRVMESESRLSNSHQKLPTKIAHLNSIRDTLNVPVY